MEGVERDIERGEGEREGGRQKEREGDRGERGREGGT